jgi:hypothetical protein
LSHSSYKTGSGIGPPRDRNDDGEEEDEDGDAEPDDELEPAVVREPDE